MSHRINAKDNTKTNYSQTYTDFARQESISLRSKLGVNSDVIISSDASNKLAVYPKSGEAAQEVAKYTKDTVFYKLNGETGELFAFKVNAEGDKIEQQWEINFREKAEMPVSLKEPQHEPVPRKGEVTISGKLFKKFADSFVPILVVSLDAEQVKLHIIDPKSGKMIFSKRLSKGYPTRYPLMELYENAMAVALSYEGKDKMFFIEVLQAPDIADTTNQPDTKVGSIEDLMYPVITDIKINWSVRALKLLQIDGTEYIITLDSKNVLRSMKTEDLTRSNINDMTKDKVKEVQLPNSLIFKEPVTIEYDGKTKNMIVHGMDLYSFQFP
eukprot:TRINITY_DN13206_c0_g1_i3.p1 TRINITY_DN13206_c0_g1~~TRINITY_DN13206_c0_g1_i3.p1  ORF type:complete len:327 (+),score=72.00 TRINITY_DN13206_c0_g1_i3:1615-2595(+)